ncbi:MAG: hypothetical protein LBS36_06555 [Oscillospiraceae bacterium]|nr:hypothetical protein [Oscillospiraceae bacterium]
MAAIIRIDKTKQYQTFGRFGASAAWWAQIVGGWEQIDPESGKPVRERISELLYSKENGIGMGIYRYNLGGGSKHSGRGKFPNPARRAESFDISESEYDWSRDKNAVYMMNRAVRDGAEEVIFFVNSPPERLTKNHKAHSDRAGRENLSKKNYAAFAKYCLDVTEHFLKEGLPVRCLSPVNEPLWVWTGGQEGCHYRPRSVRRVFEAFASALDNRPALKNLRLSGAENGDIRWFNKSYTRQLLRSKNAQKYIDGVDVHSYCLPAPFPFLNNRTAYLERFRKWMDRYYPNVDVKMSEWTHMKGGRDKGMDSALEMARVMYEDISILNVTSWQHWIAVSEVDYCDGLIYINLDTKTFETTKRLYATGNFSKFIRPGAKRVNISCGDAQLQLLAFQNGGETAVIVINPTKEKKEVSFENETAQNAKLYVTDEKNDLCEHDLRGLPDISISARSVNTILFS